MKPHGNIILSGIFTLLLKKVLGSSHPDFTDLSSSVFIYKTDKLVGYLIGKNNGLRVRTEFEFWLLKYMLDNLSESHFPDRKNLG